MNTTTAKIYKRDTLGKIRYWCATIDGHNYYTVVGVEGVATSQVASGWTRCVGKQGRTGEQQAEFEVAAEMKKKLDREYRTSIADVDVKRSAWVETHAGAQVRRLAGAVLLATEARRHPLHRDGVRIVFP